MTVIGASALARVEVPSALWRKYRMGELRRSTLDALLRAFENDFLDHFVVVPVSPVLLDRAARLVGIHQLRAYDAVQLASALAVRDVDPGIDAFACFDASLRSAAAAERFALVPP